MPHVIVKIAECSSRTVKQELAECRNDVRDMQ